jgi:hypothetical protein
MAGNIVIASALNAMNEDLAPTSKTVYDLENYFQN